jgi:hypothetical protein
MLYRQIRLYIADRKNLGFTFSKPKLVGRDYLEGKFDKSILDFNYLIMSYL